MPVDWNEKYSRRETPWDAGVPCRELVRLLDEGPLLPSRVVELGCGSGWDAILLAARGFEVTAVDISALAIEQAVGRARAAGVNVRFLHRDVLSWEDSGEPVPFVLDNGLYHYLRTVDLQGYLGVIRGLLVAGGHLAIFAGNAGDPAPGAGGPFRVTARELCAETERDFDLVSLREFRFHEVRTPSGAHRPLAWSVLLRRKR